MTQVNGSPKTILITGATDGIGLALAHIYRRQQHRLVLVGRRPYGAVPLVDFAESSYCQTDLASEVCVDTIAAFLDQKQITSLDLLIHNAGTGYYGPVAAQSAQSIQDVLTVNLWTPIALTHRLLPLVDSDSGKIVFISSVTSVIPTPDYAVYGASKAALDGFARNLRIELGNRPQIQLIHPGGTQTGMHQKSGLKREVIDWSRFPPAAVVAAKIAAVIAGNESTVTIGAGNQLMRFGGRFLGRLLDAIMQQRYRPEHR